MKDIELEVGVLKEMGQEKLIVKKYNKLQNRYKETRKNFLQQKDNFETQKNRREALKRPRSKGDQIERDTRGKLIDNLENLDKQDEQLDGIKKTAYNTADLTIAIGKKMREQRDVILSAKGEVVESNRNVMVGKQLINSMTRQECCYKALLYAVIVTLFAAILTLAILVVYKKVKK
eukprot:TRINITY_DN9523_c0_g1_i11.p1 TRINITY_DN9523_c0_g1~~TRINITY_DN9523_c0_g1_i11.p1  ORF type:complete len:176 (-),score=65.58 TRINITY_DN9523_c0_g1_i11:112-639(-)